MHKSSRLGKSIHGSHTINTCSTRDSNPRYATCLLICLQVTCSYPIFAIAVGVDPKPGARHYVMDNFYSSSHSFQKCTRSQVRIMSRRKRMRLSWCIDGELNHISRKSEFYIGTYAKTCGLQRTRGKTHLLRYETINYRQNHFT